jgi:hypothetical protein
MGTYEKAIRIPSFDDETLSSSSVILADRLEKVATRDIGKGQFVVGSTKVRPSVSERFHAKDQLGIYFQVYNLGYDEKTRKPQGTIEYALLKDNGPQPVFQSQENVADIAGASPQQVTVEKLLPLDNLAPGKYTLQVKVTDKVNNKSITPTASFVVQ